MASLKVSKRHIITLWHETQMGPMKRCMEAQAEFAEMMWALWEDMQPEVFDKKLINFEPLLKRILPDREDPADKDDRLYHEEQDEIATKEKE